MDQIRTIARGNASWRVTTREYLDGKESAESEFNRVRPEMFDKGERERVVANHNAALERQRQVNEEARKAKAVADEQFRKWAEERRKEQEEQERKEQAKLERWMACRRESEAMRPSLSKLAS